MKKLPSPGSDAKIDLYAGRLCANHNRLAVNGLVLLSNKDVKVLGARKMGMPMYGGQGIRLTPDSVGVLCTHWVSCGDCSTVEHEEETKKC